MVHFNLEQHFALIHNELEICLKQAFSAHSKFFHEKLDWLHEPGFRIKPQFNLEFHQADIERRKKEAIPDSQQLAAEIYLAMTQVRNWSKAAGLIQQLWALYEEKPLVFVTIVKEQITASPVTPTPQSRQHRLVPKQSPARKALPPPRIPTEPKFEHQEETAEQQQDFSIFREKVEDSKRRIGLSRNDRKLLRSLKIKGDGKPLSAEDQIEL